jgi:hypothetical protein
MHTKKLIDVYNLLTKNDWHNYLKMDRNLLFFVTRDNNGEVNAGVLSSYFFIMLSSFMTHPTFKGIHEEFLKLFPNKKINEMNAHWMISAWHGMLIANTFPEKVESLMAHHYHNWWKFLQAVENKCLDIQKNTNYINDEDFQKSIANFLLYTRRLMDLNKFYKDSVINLKVHINAESIANVSVRTNGLAKDAWLTPVNEEDNCKIFQNILELKALYNNK